MNDQNPNTAAIAARLNQLVYAIDSPTPAPTRSPDGRWAPPAWSLVVFGIALLTSGFGSGIWVSRAIAANAMARASEADAARAAAATTFQECSQKVMEQLNGKP